MRKVEILPTRDREAGYGPGYLYKQLPTTERNIVDLRVVDYGLKLIGRLRTPLQQEFPYRIRHVFIVIH